MLLRRNAYVMSCFGILHILELYSPYIHLTTKEKTMAQLDQEHFHVIDSNKARRHEELKKEKEVVFNSSDLNPETKNKMIEFVKTNSTHKLREVVRSFFS